MRRINLDSFLKQVGARFRENYDDNGAILATNLTRATVRELFAYKVLDTPWANGDLISLDTSPPEGAQSVDWYMIKDVAPAGSSFVAPGGPFPRVDIAGEGHNNRAHTMGCSFGFELSELQGWELQGLGGSLPEGKARAARRFHDADLNDAIMRGVAALGISGMINMPGSLQLQAGVVAGTTADWLDPLVTPNQITDTFEALYSAIYDGSNGKLKPNTCVIPSKVATRLRRQNSLANGDSIITWLRETFPEITKWEIDPRMNTAGLGGTKAMLLYNRDKDMVWALMPQLLRPLPVYIKHQNTEQAFQSRYAGIACPYPTSVALLSGV